MFRSIFSPNVSIEIAHVYTFAKYVRFPLHVKSLFHIGKKNGNRKSYLHVSRIICSYNVQITLCDSVIDGLNHLGMQLWMHSLYGPL